MTAAEAVAGALRSAGVPFTEWAWPTGMAPELPWCVWLEEDHGDFHADDTNYASLPRMRVELYQREPDEGLTSRVRAALSAVAPTSETRAWSATEGCQVTYFQLTPTPTQNGD